MSIYSIIHIIPPDKLLHFGISFLLIIFIFGLRKYYLKQKGFVRIFAYSFRDVLIIWIFKEIIDALWYWNPEFLDFVADASWVVIPVYIFFIITLYKKLRKSRKIKYEKKYILKFKAEKSPFRKLKIFLWLVIIWLWNTFYLFLKIPLLAIKETFCFIKKWIKITIN